MATATDHQPIEFTEFHLFAGIGGGSLGAAKARANWLGVPGLIRNIGAIDSDPLACEDYRNLTGSSITCLDLFDREQYTAFHGKQPPTGWQEATPADVLTAAGGRCPDIVFTSPPCKGFSGLLPGKSAASDKYQALNRLTVRSIRLTLQAFAAAPPRIILLENVPRIKSRGAHLLDEIRSLLKAHGYVCHDADHDCGEIGGLGQRRKRYLLIARHKSRCKPFVYQPPKRDLKTIGNIIGPLPLPDDPAMGPMHRLPRLKWLTWLRLALIPAGGDWRDLQKIAPEEYRIVWESHRQTKVADTRVPESANRHHSHFSVTGFDQTGPTVTGATHVANGAACVSDPRMGMNSERFNGSPGLYGVMNWHETAPVVTGSAWPTRSNSPATVSDPRLSESKGVYPNRFRIVRWDGQAPTVTGDTDIQCGAPSIGDPRLKYEPRPGNYRVLKMDETCGAVVGGQGVGVSNGPQAVADTRLNCGSRSGYMRVLTMDETSPAVIGSARTTASNGPSVIADHRMNCSPREGTYGVMPWDDASQTVISSMNVHSCQAAIEDPRLKCSPRGNTKGPLGVQPWDETAATVFGSLDLHSGPGAIADVRIPGNNERLDPPPVIIALDGTWHRPLTTMELLALQSFPLKFSDGRPVVLAGKSDSSWRERIGNAVPPDASRRMHEQILLSLLQNELGETFTLGTSPIWVQPIRRQEVRICNP